MLASILGQKRVVEILRTAIAARKVHHAYLFEGPVGVGKASTARALAMALNCERDPVDGCGRCPSCEKIEAGLHPDFVIFDMTPKGLTERMRELVGLVGFRPHEGRARVVVLDPADALAGPQDVAQPANVILKTLEEPPPGTHFVLVTAEPKRLPITVRSRCQRLRFAPLDEEAIAGWLSRERGIAPDEARRAAAESSGSLARALEVIEGADEAARRAALVERLLSAAKKAASRGTPSPSAQGGSPAAQAVIDAAAEVGGDREEAEAVCALLWTTLRDALLMSERLDGGRVPPARAERARRLIGERASASLLAALAATEEARAALKGNVAPALALEHLVFRMAGSIR